MAITAEQAKELWKQLDSFNDDQKYKAIIRIALKILRPDVYEETALEITLATSPIAIATLEDLVTFLNVASTFQTDKQQPLIDNLLSYFHEDEILTLVEAMAPLEPVSTYLRNGSFLKTLLSTLTKKEITSEAGEILRSKFKESLSKLTDIAKKYTFTNLQVFQENQTQWEEFSIQFVPKFKSFFEELLRADNTKYIPALALKVTQILAQDLGGRPQENLNKFELLSGYLFLLLINPMIVDISNDMATLLQKDVVLKTAKTVQTLAMTNTNTNLLLPGSLDIVKNGSEQKFLVKLFFESIIKPSQKYAVQGPTENKEEKSKKLLLNTEFEFYSELVKALESKEEKDNKVSISKSENNDSASFWFRFKSSNVPPKKGESSLSPKKHEYDSQTTILNIRRTINTYIKHFSEIEELLKKQNKKPKTIEEAKNFLKRYEDFIKIKGLTPGTTTLDQVKGAEIKSKLQQNSALWKKLKVDSGQGRGSLPEQANNCESFTSMGIVEVKSVTQQSKTNKNFV